MTHIDILNEAYADQQLERRRRLKALAVKFWIGLEEPPTTAAGEDVLEMLNGTESTERWAAITRSSVHSYFIKTFGSRQRAADWTIENVFDDIFCELPWAICDLDSDEKPWGYLYLVTRVTPVFTPEG